MDLTRRGLNWGEAPADARLRELEEETGLLGREPQLAGVFSGIYARTPERPLDPVHHVSVLYFLEAVPGELRYEQNGSTCARGSHLKTSWNCRSYLWRNTGANLR